MSAHAVETPVAPPEPMAEVAARANAMWPRHIRKVYVADPAQELTLVFPFGEEYKTQNNSS